MIPINHVPTEPINIPVHMENGMFTKATIAQVESKGEIPEPLASQTMALLRVHQVNGDLDWVLDMIHELRVQAKRTPPLGAGQPLAFASQGGHGA